MPHIPSAPRLRLVVIGDEILLGRIQDTNTAWLADRSLGWGLRLAGVAVVGDEQQAIVASLRAAVASAELVIVTGGLGPTEDDRTRDALAELMAVPLVEDAAAWQQIVGYYRRIRGRRGVPRSNRRQAQIPAGATTLVNDRGTAPGLLARIDGALVACLPGVPHEMQAMADRLAADLPRQLTGLVVPHVAEIHFGGLGESSAQDRLGDLLADRRLQIGICAHDGLYMTVRIVGARTPVARRAAAIRRVMRPYLLPEPGFAPSLVALLAQRGERITVAESCTGGAIAAQLTAVPGASAVFEQGLIAYHNRVKQDVLGVPAQLIARHGVVSGPVVEAMATGALAWSGASLAVAASGIAGPGGGSPDKPVGTVWIAVAQGTTVRSRRLHLAGSRERIQARAAASALHLAWQQLTGAGS